MDLQEKIELFEEKIKRYEHIIDEFLPLPQGVLEFYLKTKAINIPKTTHVYVAVGGERWDDNTDIDGVFDSYKKAKEHEEYFENDDEHWACCHREKVK